MPRKWCHGCQRLSAVKTPVKKGSSRARCPSLGNDENHDGVGGDDEGDGDGDGDGDVSQISDKKRRNTTKYCPSDKKNCFVGAVKVFLYLYHTSCSISVWSTNINLKPFGIEITTGG